MQFDPYKKRNVPIDFTAAESCQFVWEEEEYRILFITNGKLEISLNQVSMKLRKGDILCLTNQDSFAFISSAELAAASFRFEPSFLKTIQLSQKNETFSMAPEIKTGSILFKRDSRHSGVYHASNAVYTQLLEYFFVMGTEVFAKSDSLWVCRIKKYLIQFLYLLEETSNREEQVYLDQLLSYIHTNYRKKNNVSGAYRVNEFKPCDFKSKISRAFWLHCYGLFVELPIESCCRSFDTYRVNCK
ncbi:hypothetical protein [Listeria grayi]|uniref:hypothetical protein n=1 Tax=Listeria grayi TaxID=1641 RepID=UPI0004B0AB4E|nr:hypothetical protein [Listeria grayi]